MSAAVTRSCGCGSKIEIESDEDKLDVLLDHCDQWENAHKLADAEVRERVWNRQSAVADIHASFMGAGHLEMSDEVRTWIINLQESFNKLQVIA